MDDIYDGLGVRKWINGAGYMTRLGGNLMPDEVQDAVREAANSFVDIAELQSAASEVIVRHTGAEAGIVTTGAAAALTLGTAACLAGLDAARMDRLPDTEGMPDEVVMPRLHRSSYDHAIRAAGAKIREFGVNDRALNAGIRCLDGWEIESAITEKTAALAFMASPHNISDLEMMVEISDRHDLPVIVDAAPWLPPVENLRKFIDAGASLVAFSGGKAIRGPQGTGVLCGKKDLVASALLQQLDMNIEEGSWNPPALIPRERLVGHPRHGIGRGMKVSKENIVGLIVALERFVSQDHAAAYEAMETLLSAIEAGLAGTPSLRTELVPVSVTGRRPILQLHFDEMSCGRTAVEISALLQSGTTPIHLTERFATDGTLIIDPAGLTQRDVEFIVVALREILTERRMTA